MSLATNRSLAESNLGLQPRLERGKAQLLERYGELRLIRQAVTERHQKLESHRQGADPEGLLAVLQAEGAKVEDESEVSGAVRPGENSVCVSQCGRESGVCEA
ncbi:vacuolar protein sorting-associated protein 37B-like [Hypanus sabinus]|uniref:vacuolar protein sorting-associated protein 37B-like n=1 Tax=Hypanus sabinus TaxID=79690 RepID=UPI0028C4F50B|nr:vacuolar protein sorting-associated protein 37B-like [Hypanus sabinus]